MKLLISALILSVSLLVAATPEEDVKAAMEQWKVAVIKKDRPTLEKLMHEKISYGHSNAKMENKKEAIDAFMAPSMTYKAIETKDTTYRTHGKSVLVLTNMTVKNAQNGEDRTIPLSVLLVWVKDQGRWQMMARQSTRIQ